MNPVTFYQRKINEKFHFYANWMPNKALSLGSIITFQKGVPVYVASLESKGIDFSEKKGRKKKSNFSYHLNTNFSVTSKADAALEINDTVPSGTFDLNIAFSKSDAFAFDAAGCITSEIEDKLTLANDIKKLYYQKDGSWNKDWFVIDSIVHADSLTVLIPEAIGSSITLNCTGKLSSVNLADAAVKFAYKSQEGQLLKFLNESGCTPLFTARRLRDAFLSRIFRLGNATMFGGKIVKDEVEIKDSSSVGSGLRKDLVLDQIWQSYENF